MLAAALVSPLAAVAEYFRHITLDDGLSQPSVMAIAQDCLGRIWLGTREGVNLYDGNSVTAYKGWITDPVSGDKIWIGNQVSSIHADASGSLFMHIDNHIVRYDLERERFTLFTAGKNVSAMTGYDGEIAFIASDSIFLKERDSDTARFRFIIPSTRNVTHLALDSARYYISTSGGLHIFDRDSRRSEIVMEGSAIHSVLIARDGTLWISSTQGGLYRLAPGDKEPRLASLPNAPQEVMGSLQCRTAVEDPAGRIWYGSFTGLFRHDPATGQTRHIEIPANMGGLTHSSVFGMLCDRRGNIWAGTYYGGVNYFSPAYDHFVNFNYESLAPHGLYQSFVIDMATDRDGNLWFGTDGAGICCVDSEWNILQQLTTRSGANALRQNNVKSIAYDRGSHRLFVGTHLGGLSVYDIASGRMTNLIDRLGPDRHPGNVIHHLQIDDGKLFVSSRSGLSWADLATLTFHPIDPSSDASAFDIAADGTLYFINASFQIVSVSHPSSARAEISVFDRLPQRAEPTDICCTDSGLYVTTLGDGIVYYPGYDPAAVRNINTSGGTFPDDYCYAVREGAGGTVYILTRSHVARLNCHGPSVESILFEDYFPDSHIIDECGLLTFPSGDLLVGSTKGITRLSSASFHTPDALPDSSSIFFSHLAVQNTGVSASGSDGILDSALPLASGIRLPHDRNSFSVYLGVSDYTTVSGSPVVEYFLDGLGRSHWTNATGGTIHFNSVPPGNYRLRVRRAGTTDEISIPVTILRPWYSTWWAWLIYFLVAATVITYIIHKSLDAARLRHSLKKEKTEREQIEKLNKEKLVFFTNVSHEFQTPLTLIMSHIDLLRTRYRRNERLLEALERIHQHAHQMSHLITQLLEFRKLQQNHQILRLGYQSASDSLRHTALPFADYAVKRSIKFDINLPASDPRGFYDPALIDRVLVNILSNAFKYTPDGGSISCSVSEGHGGSVVFVITDTGKGISEKDLPYIFDRFYNGDSDENKRYNVDYRSTGIGLAFAKSIVDKHHGTIAVTSREGEGTSFTVTLPGSPEPFEGDMNIIIDTTPANVGSPRVATPVSPEGATRPSGDTGTPASADDEEDMTGTPEESDDDNRPLVLIVEDNPELRHNLARFFSAYFRIAEASDGNDGLAKARSLNPAIIISDVMMPGMSGTEMCRVIKADIALCHIPVILLTALSAAESRLEGLNANADDYVTKPFDSTLLLARIDNLLRGRKILMQQFSQNRVSEVDMTIVNPLDRKLIAKATAYIEKHMDDSDLDMDSLASEIGVSRTLFFNKFKSLTGMTPNAFTLNYRLKHAAALLTAQPHLSVVEIAERTGFTSAAYFGRCFKKQFGIAPLYYRRGETVAAD